jgi:hypothetical protein
MPIYIIFGEVLGIFIIIDYKVTSITSSFPYKSIEVFINLLDVA